MILLLFPITASLKIWEDTGLVLIPNENTFLAESHTEISLNFVRNFSNIENDLNCNEKETTFDAAKYFQQVMNENLEEFGFDNIQDFREQVNIQKYTEIIFDSDFFENCIKFT